jgi:hypothetical protein
VSQIFVEPVVETIEPLGLVEFIRRSIDNNGHCTIRDNHVLTLLSGGTRNCESRIRRLRLFACQHDWTVTSHEGRTAVFTPLLKALLPHLISGSHPSAEMRPASEV